MVLQEKVFIGLSGGVDSGVSAALLQKAGYLVTGVFIKIQIPGYPCPAAEDRLEAMRVAAHLRIPFLEIDLSKEYEREVFRPSIEEFKEGRTPNPDTLCNEKIKFGLFYDFARSKGADIVATGHYAMRKNGELYMGIDPEKDQSYFLWGVPEEALQHVLFPVGSMPKKEVRRLAKKFGLPNAVRKDSQGLCFLGDISIEDMLEKELAPSGGAVLSEEGEVIGSHKGAQFYTLGQRHGFELFVHTRETPPYFVVSKNIEKNTITVSTSQFPKHARATRLVLTHTNWIGKVNEGPCEARYRYRGMLIKAKLLKKEGGRAEAELAEPHYVPLGQSLVFYSGSRMLGGGVVEDATLVK